MGDTRATVIILMREREGKSGGGKGFLLSDDKAFTLATSNFHTIFMFSHNQGLDPQASEEASPTLRSGGNGMAVVYPIDDAREVEKHQNGTGIGEDGAPAYTLDWLQAPAVVYPLDLRNATRDADKLDEQNRQGLGVGNEGDPSPTITNAFVPGVVAVDTYNQTLSSTNQTLRKGNAGIDHTGGVMIFNNNDDKAYTMQVGGIGEESTMSFQEEKSYCLPANPMSDRIQSVGYSSSVVRRLTPTECERLQGFPDGWTDGQADSHRYKQMGNAVAVPVVQWIIDRLVS